MKLLWIIILSHTLCFSQNIELKDLRASFIEADQSEEKCYDLINKSNKIMEGDDVAKAYYAAAIMISAQFKANPFDKWNKFLTGKDILENLIESNYNNLEIRFLRYCMQKKTPRLLGYNDKIEEDKKLLATLTISLDKELFNFINPILKTLNND